MWNDAIVKQTVDTNKNWLVDAAIEEFTEIDKQDELYYDQGEDTNTAQSTIVQGVHAFIDDIVPFTPIPKAVEKFLEVQISGNPIISAIGGTIDYLTDSVIADVKTSKRKPVVSNYTTQQSIYKYLAMEHGYNIEHSLIQGVVLKKVPEGHILEMEPKIDQAKFLVNQMLSVMALAATDTVPLELLFRGNPKYYLCSPKYCAFFNECDYAKGEIPCQNKPVL
jgi:hypothetical protein